MSDIVLALKGANKDVANKLFSNMSTRMRQNIEEDLEITTNVRIRDVEAGYAVVHDFLSKFLLA